jgi:hypothetical protein
MRVTVKFGKKQIKIDRHTIKNAIATPIAAMAIIPAPIPPTTAPVLSPLEESALLVALAELVVLEEVLEKETVTTAVFAGSVVITSL